MFYRFVMHKEKRFTKWPAINSTHVSLLGLFAHLRSYLSFSSQFLPAIINLYMFLSRWRLTAEIIGNLELLLSDLIQFTQRDD